MSVVILPKFFLLLFLLRFLLISHGEAKRNIKKRQKYSAQINDHWHTQEYTKLLIFSSSLLIHPPSSFHLFLSLSFSYHFSSFLSFSFPFHLSLPFIKFFFLPLFLFILLSFCLSTLASCLFPLLPSRISMIHISKIIYFEMIIMIIVTMMILMTVI